MLVEQGGRLLGRYAVRQAVPNRPLHVPITWVAGVGAQGGAVTIRLSPPGQAGEAGASSRE